MNSVVRWSLVDYRKNGYPGLYIVVLSLFLWDGKGDVLNLCQVRIKVFEKKFKVNFSNTYPQTLFTLEGFMKDFKAMVNPWPKVVWHISKQSTKDIFWNYSPPQSIVTPIVFLDFSFKEILYALSHIHSMIWRFSRYPRDKHPVFIKLAPVTQCEVCRNWQDFLW